MRAAPHAVVRNEVRRLEHRGDWQELVNRLEGEGVATWVALREWLARPVDTRKRARRVWPMPRELRLSLPAAGAPVAVRFGSAPALADARLSAALWWV